MIEPIVIDRFIPLATGQIFTRTWQAGDTGAATIVLLHDSLGSVAQWRDFPARLALACQRTVIAYDRLGFGQSSSCDQAASLDFIEREASDIFPVLMQALG